MCENAGDLLVKIENITWMNDDHVLQTNSFVSVCKTLCSVAVDSRY